MSKVERSRKPASADKQPSVATVVSGLGTDDDIRVRCAEKVPGWSALDQRKQDEMIALMRRFEELQGGPRYSVTQDEDGIKSSPETHNGDVTLHVLRLVDAMGTTSMDLINERMGDLLNYHRKSNARGVDSQKLNADLAFIRGGNPADPVQSTLLMQMAATHDAAMRSLACIGTSDWVDQAKLYGNLSTKLLGLFTRQAETLAKLQRGGEQIIKHVHIDNRGGQAVVTDQVIAKGGAGVEVEGRAHEHGFAGGAFDPALLGYDAAGNGVPVSSDEGEAEMLPARRGAGKRSAAG